MTLPGAGFPLTSQSQSQSQTKRPRPKSLMACEGCRQRRSRCDLIDRHGCHRCKQLGAPCSFLSGDEATGVAGAVGDVDLGASRLRGGLAVPESSSILTRLARLETILANSSQPGGSAGSGDPPLDQTAREASPSNDGLPMLNASSPNRAPGPASTPATPYIHVPALSPSTVLSTQREAEGRDQSWYLEQADPETYGLILRGMKSKGEHGLKDPVAEGVITAGQAEAAYQL